MRARYLRAPALVAFLFGVMPAGAAEPARFYVETRHLSAGADLLTIFGEVRGESIPLVAVLRDTEQVGSDLDATSSQAVQTDAAASNETSSPKTASPRSRLRYVWVLTQARPTLVQRISAATPFFYWKTGAGKGSSRPSPIINLSSPARPVWNALVGILAQVLAADPEGALIRASTRSYRNNARDQRQMHLLEGLAVVAQLEKVQLENAAVENARLPQQVERSGFEDARFENARAEVAPPDIVPTRREGLNETELLALQARLSLGARLMGGFVSDSHLPDAYMKERVRSTEDRGHNWELLRQRAEANGLIFEPFGDPDTAGQAMLWIDLADASKPHAFNSQFMGMKNPYGDPRIQNWQGYYAERDGRALIPLALYALDHPKVPLLIVDFRDSLSPKSREMLRHAFVDAMNGVVGISTWGNLPYMAGAWTFNFVRTRHGSATQRSARIKAYSLARQWLAMDTSLDPELHSQLESRLETLGVNPLENSVSGQAGRARGQYAALERFVDDPDGLAAKLERDRESERTASVHRVPARFGFVLLHWTTLGKYNHRERELQPEAPLVPVPDGPVAGDASTDDAPPDKAPEVPADTAASAPVAATGE